MPLILKKAYIIVLFLTSFSVQSQSYWSSLYNWTFSNFPPSSITKDNDNNLFMACSVYDYDLDGFISQVLVSSDYGITWDEVNTNGINTFFAISEVEFFDNKIFISGSNYSVYPYDTRIYVSEDNGQSWNLSMQGYDPLYIPQDFAIKDNEIYVSCNEFEDYHLAKLFKSTDGGQNWSELLIQSIPESIGFDAITFSGENMIMGVQLENFPFNSGMGGTVFVSPGNGLNWVESSNGYDTTYIPNSLTKADNGDVYLTACKHNSTANGWIKKLFVSTDHGLNWSEVSTSGLETLAYITSGCFLGNRLYISGRNDSNTGLLFRTTYGVGLEELKPEVEKPLISYDLTGRTCSTAQEGWQIDQFKNGRGKLVYRLK